MQPQPSYINYNAYPDQQDLACVYCQSFSAPLTILDQDIYIYPYTYNFGRRRVLACVQCATLSKQQRTTIYWEHHLLTAQIQERI